MRFNLKSSGLALRTAITFMQCSERTRMLTVSKRINRVLGKFVHSEFEKSNMDITDDILIDPYERCK